MLFFKKKKTFQNQPAKIKEYTGTHQSLLPGWYLDAMTTHSGRQKAEDECCAVIG